MDSPTLYSRRRDGLASPIIPIFIQSADRCIHRGKTVQIVVFIGTIVEKFKASPCLIVVPNSTITNWVREFDRWAPHIRVVPYHGEAKARGIIRRYELFHDNVKKGTTSAKYHVLITTYDMLSNQKEFGSVFNSAPRWETLVVDEGQRCERKCTFVIIWAHYFILFSEER